jgi:hypothetical protein
MTTEAERRKRQVQRQVYRAKLRVRAKRSAAPDGSSMSTREQLFEVAQQLDDVGETPALLLAWTNLTHELRRSKVIGISAEAVSLTTDRLRNAHNSRGLPPLRKTFTEIAQGWCGERGLA